MKGGTDLMRSARIAGLVVAVSLAVTGIGSSQTTDTPVQLKDVSIERAFDGASVTVKTSGPTQYEAKLIDSPTRLVIDLSGATYSSSKSRWMSGVDPVKEVRGSQWRKGVARVVVEMNRSDVGYRIDETPDGLVVAVENSNGRSPETKLESAKLTERRLRNVLRQSEGLEPLPQLGHFGLLRIGLAKLLLNCLHLLAQEELALALLELGLHLGLDPRPELEHFQLAVEDQ